MESKSSTTEDQAAELRKLFNEVQSGDVEDQTEDEPLLEDNLSVDKGEQLEDIEEQKHGGDIDVLNLPPRKEVHDKLNKRTHVKVSRSFFRLIIFILIIVAVLAGLYYVWGEDLLYLQNNI